MREIRFRAWSRKRQSMSYDDIYPEASQDWDLWEQSLHCMLHAVEADHVLMQYTGLKDKNGKEIYEGDIVDQVAMNVVTGVIEYDAPEWRLKSIHSGMSFVLTHPPYALEVIGNVYENPELLSNP